MLYFFVSYARGDDDEYVERFYSDLCREVRVRAGLRPEHRVGFLDAHSIELGATWSQELVSALSACHVFLPLYSPGYFLSESCGKEWAAFAERLDRYERGKGVRPPALMPILWFPHQNVHAVARPIQYTNESLGDVYHEQGLRQLVRLHRNRDAYLEFVSELAEKVVVRATQHPLPPVPEPIAFDRLASPFHNAVAGRNGLVRPPEPTGEAKALDAGSTDAEQRDRPPRSQYVHFVIATSSRDELASVRSALDFYGASHEDWAPYYPSLPEPIGRLARSVAAEKRFGSEIANIDRLAERIDWANQNNQIVVLLVDAWATRLEGHRAALTEYDGRNEPTTAVLVPCSIDDEETQRYAVALSAGMFDVLTNNVLRHDSIFRPTIPTHREFRTDLQEVLQEAQNRVFARGTVYRRPPGESPGQRPILEGP